MEARVNATITLLEVGESSDRLTSGCINTEPGGEDGDNSPLDVNHELGQEPQTGTDESEPGRLVSEKADEHLRTRDILERFNSDTKSRLREKSQEHYGRTFVRFAEHSGLDDLTRRTVAGPRGKQLILAFLDTIPKHSRRYAIAEIKTVWSYGMNLPWPIDSKRDLGKLPRTRRRQSPSDRVVEAWAEAMNRERGTRQRLEWLLIAQLGLRPSHICRMRWRNVQLDDMGTARTIVADGATENFKTNSPVAARLPPDVVDALEAWRKEHPAPRSENPILPALGGSDGTMEQDSRAIRDHWRSLAKKWGLPHLRPVDMRHWVATACRRCGLSRTASAYMMGHDSNDGSGSMRDWYDNPQLEDIFREQEEKLPNGVLGILKPPDVELIDGLPPDAARLMRDYLCGDIGTLEFANRAENLKNSQQKKAGLDSIPI